MRRTPRDLVFGLLPLLALAAAALLAGTAIAEAQGDEWPEHVFVPLTMRKARLGDLVVVGTAGPTVPPTPTIRRPPTRTPEPTDTPTPEGGALIAGRLLENGQPAPEGLGGSASGPGLFIRRCTSDSSCEILGRTAVDRNGRYSFRVEASLQTGQYLQVAWRNEWGMTGQHETGGVASMLGTWYSQHITRADGGQTITLPDIEVSGIELIAPTKGTGFSGFPIDYAWAPWAGPAQQYKWSMCRCCQYLDQRIGAFQRSTGTETAFQLTDFPPGTRPDPDDKLCWYIHVDMTGNRGTGTSFEARMTWFFLRAFAPFGVDPDDWSVRAAVSSPRAATGVGAVNAMRAGAR